VWHKSGFHNVNKKHFFCDLKAVILDYQINQNLKKNEHEKINAPQTEIVAYWYAGIIFNSAHSI
jgi:hypothetical protein